MIALMAVSLGGVSIWSMHFVGMTALCLKNDESDEALQINYRIDFTMASVVVVILFSFGGLRIALFDKIFTSDKTDAVYKYLDETKKMSSEEMGTRKRRLMTFLINSLFQRMEYLIAGGVVTGSGIVVMHYLGNDIDQQTWHTVMTACDGLGMSAMIFNGKIKWDIGIIASSCVIAIGTVINLILHCQLTYP
jgi:NO-binding membrane sensor protein with MHYT domain